MIERFEEQQKVLKKNESEIKAEKDSIIRKKTEMAKFSN